MEYLVKWKNFDDMMENTWEPAENLKSVPQLITKFEKEVQPQNIEQIQPSTDVSLIKNTKIRNSSNKSESKTNSQNGKNKKNKTGKLIKQTIESEKEKSSDSKDKRILTPTQKCKEIKTLCENKTRPKAEDRHIKKRQRKPTLKD